MGTGPRGEEAEECSSSTQLSTVNVIARGPMNSSAAVLRTVTGVSVVSTPRDSDGSEVLEGGGGPAEEVTRYIMGGMSDPEHQPQEGLARPSEVGSGMVDDDAVGRGGGGGGMSMSGLELSGQDNDEEEEDDDDDDDDADVLLGMVTQEPGPGGEGVGMSSSAFQDLLWLPTSRGDGPADVDPRTVMSAASSPAFFPAPPPPSPSPAFVAAGMGGDAKPGICQAGSTGFSLPIARTRQTPSIPLPKAALLAVSAAQHGALAAAAAAGGGPGGLHGSAGRGGGGREEGGGQKPPPGGQRKRVDWSKGEAAERMRKAVQECREEGRKGSWRAVARKYGIAWAVLYPRLSGKIAVNASLGAKSMLSREMESKIYDHCVSMAEQGMGLDWSDVKQLASNLAEMAGIQRFKATDGWVRQFQHRFPQLKRYKVELLQDDDMSSVGSGSGDQRRRRCKPRHKYILYNAASGNGPPPPLMTLPPYASTSFRNNGSGSSTPVSSRPDSPTLMSTRPPFSSTYTLPSAPALGGQPPPMQEMGRRDYCSGAIPNSSGSSAPPHALHSSSFVVFNPPPGPAPPASQADRVAAAQLLLSSTSTAPPPGLGMMSDDDSNGHRAAYAPSFQPFLRAGGGVRYPRPTDGFLPRMPLPPPPYTQRASSDHSLGSSSYGEAGANLSHGQVRELVGAGPYSDAGMSDGEEDDDDYEDDGLGGEDEDGSGACFGEQHAGRGARRGRRAAPWGEEEEDEALPRKMSTRYQGRRSAAAILNPEQPVLDLLISQGIVSSATTRPSMVSMKAFLDRFRLRLPMPRTKARREDYIDFMLRLAGSAPPEGWDSLSLQRLGERQRAGGASAAAAAAELESSRHSSSTSSLTSLITHGLPCFAVGPPLTTSSSASTSPTAMLTPVSCSSPVASSGPMACLTAAASASRAMGHDPFAQASSHHHHHHHQPPHHQPLVLRGGMVMGGMSIGECSNSSSDLGTIPFALPPADQGQYFRGGYGDQ